MNQMEQKNKPTRRKSRAKAQTKPRKKSKPLKEPDPFIQRLTQAEVHHPETMEAWDYVRPQVVDGVLKLVKYEYDPWGSRPPLIILPSFKWGTFKPNWAVFFAFLESAIYNATRNRNLYLITEAEMSVGVYPGFFRIKRHNFKTSKKHEALWVDMYDILKTVLKTNLVMAGLTKKVDSSFGQFVAKSIHGLKDKQEVDVTYTVNRVQLGVEGDYIPLTEVHEIEE